MDSNPFLTVCGIELRTFRRGRKAIAQHSLPPLFRFQILADSPDWSPNRRAVAWWIMTYSVLCDQRPAFPLGAIWLG
jgi:hypothetical protein